MDSTISQGNSSDAVLGIAGEFAGAKERTPHDQAMVLVYSDKAGTLYGERSVDGENWDHAESVSVSAGVAVQGRGGAKAIRQGALLVANAIRQQQRPGSNRVPFANLLRQQFSVRRHGSGILGAKASYAGSSEHGQKQQRVAGDW